MKILIFTTKEINNLQSLANLKHICFKDPQYGYNPITILCNYSLYVLYHLPGLVSLDAMSVSHKQYQEIADVNLIISLFSFSLHFI